MRRRGSLADLLAEADRVAVDQADAHDATAALVAVHGLLEHLTPRQWLDGAASALVWRATGELVTRREVEAPEVSRLARVHHAARALGEECGRPEGPDADELDRALADIPRAELGQVLAAGWRWSKVLAGRGGYVVAAGSITKAGTYRATGGQVAPLPGWLLRALSPAPAAPRVTSGMVSMAPRSRGDRLAPLLRHVAAARQGNRNSALFWAACRAFEHADAGRLDPDEARAELLDAGVQIGLTVREARATLESAARRILGGAA